MTQVSTIPLVVARHRCSASGSAGPMSPNPTFELAGNHPIGLLIGGVI
jgi:hypothetical protein